MSELPDKSALEQNRMFRRKEVSARELLEAHVERIEAVNPVVNAIVGMDISVAEQQAKALDEIRARPKQSNSVFGSGAGLVTAHKDLVDTADFVTTYGSPHFAQHRPTEDNLLVRRMREAGTVALGKTNTPELGAGSHTFNPVYGMTRNPYNPNLSAGGSSGGAAVALRTGMVAIADGSDLGGSLRNPAAWNNVVGFRSSPRVVPRSGAGNPWSPMAIAGPMARSVEDMVLLLRIMSRDGDGAAVGDPLSHVLSIPTKIDPPKGRLRVAWSKDLGGLPVEREITEVLERFRGDVELIGWDVTEDEPDFSGADETFIALRAFMFLDSLDTFGDHIDSLKPNVQDEIKRGQSLSATAISEAFAHLNVLWKRGLAFFENYDLLIGPVTQVSPFPVEIENPTEVAGHPMESYLHWMLSCCRVTTLGLPVVSLPAGFTDGGMPVGAQLIGAPRADVALLQAAKALEAATGFGKRAPDLAALTS